MGLAVHKVFIAKSDLFLSYDRIMLEQISFKENGRGHSGYVGDGCLHLISRYAMRLEDLFAPILGVSPADLSDTSSPDNVDGWDSLMGINLIMGMQETYRVRFSTQEIEQMWSLGDARRVLAGKGVSA